MKNYFELQYLMANRKLKEAGINPILGYPMGLLAFILLSEYIFHITEFSKYLLILACLSFQFRLSEKRRTDFVLSTFGDKLKNRIRIIENTVVCIPFASTLAYKNLFLEATILLLCSIVIALFSFRSGLAITVPTPFSKNPFEFSTGFRKVLLVFPLAYSLTIISIAVGNFNLGIFSMLLVFLTTLSFYSKPEEDYYVWVHADTPQAFLIRKIRMASKNSVLLAIPIIIGLLLFYPYNYDITLLFLLLGILYLWTIILAKYAAFPSAISLPEGIIVGFAVSFPPLIVLIIPYYYTKSIKNLSIPLND